MGIGLSEVLSSTFGGHPRTPAGYSRAPFVVHELTFTGLAG